MRIVPQARAGIVERLGRYHRTLDAGPGAHRAVHRPRQAADRPARAGGLVPAAAGDHRGQPDGQIDSVIYFQVTDPKAATYEIADYIPAIEQLTVTTLRNVIGGMTLEDTLTSRDNINAALRTVLDEATGKWGIRVNRVELKAVDPPPSIQEAMEKQMRAERDRRAAILTAEGVKQSQILTAEGEKQSHDPARRGPARAQILKAEGQSKAIETVFDGDPPGRRRPQAAGLPVPADAAADRAGRLEQDLDHPQRVHARRCSKLGAVLPKPEAEPASRSAAAAGSARSLPPR